jgi:hypothetical protein
MPATIAAEHEAHRDETDKQDERHHRPAGQCRLPNPIVAVRQVGDRIALGNGQQPALQGDHHAETLDQ